MGDRRRGVRRGAEQQRQGSGRHGSCHGPHSSVVVAAAPGGGSTRTVRVASMPVSRTLSRAGGPACGTACTFRGIGGGRGRKSRLAIQPAASPPRPSASRRSTPGRSGVGLGVRVTVTVTVGVAVAVTVTVTVGVAVTVTVGAVTTVTDAEPEFSRPDEEVSCATAVKMPVVADPGTVAEYMTARADGVPAGAVPCGARLRPVIVIFIALGSAASVHAVQVVAVV